MYVPLYILCEDRCLKQAKILTYFPSAFLCICDENTDLQVNTCNFLYPAPIQRNAEQRQRIIFAI